MTVPLLPSLTDADEDAILGKRGDTAQLEYKRLIAGPDITITHGTETIKIEVSSEDGIYPRVVSQTTEPVSGTGPTQVNVGEMIMWIDTDDSDALYLVYNQSGTVKTVQLL